MEKLNYQFQEKWNHEVGNLQSPIYFKKNDVKQVKGNVLTLSKEYMASSMINKLNNLSIQAQGTTLVDGRKYKLQEVHVHHMAEHGFDGENELRPMEVHFVHRNELGQILVIAVTFKFGTKNPIFQTWLDGIQNDFTLDQKLNLSGLFPKVSQYYRYLGSLTTPPLTEGVEWIVFEKPQTLSIEQLDQYASFFKEHNNRNFQKNNGRTIQKYAN